MLKTLRLALLVAVTIFVAYKMIVPQQPVADIAALIAQ
jgi:hypothetical protein